MQFQPGVDKSHEVENLVEKNIESYRSADTKKFNKNSIMNAN